MIGIHANYLTVYGSDRKFYFDPKDGDSQAEAKEKANAHAKARKAALESKLGRTLSNADVIDYYTRKMIEKNAGRTLPDSEVVGGLKYREDRTPFQVDNDNNFSPVKKPAGRYDKMKADILQKMEDKRVAAMSSLERQLYDLERLEQQDAEQIAEANAREAHLRNPRVKAALKELNNLLESMDDSRTASEVARVRNAIIQWECHDGCTDTAETMLRAALDHEDAREREINQAKLDQIAAIEKTLAVPRDEPQKLNFARTGDLLEDGHALFQAIFDADLPFDQLDKVHAANEVFRESGDSSAIEKLLDTYAVPDGQVLAE